MTPMLFAISGPLKGALFRLSNLEVTIGRHSSNQLCIGDLSVSRHHCRIVGGGDRYAIHDLDSNNGTLVNGSPVVEKELADGDEIGVGTTVFRYVEAAERIEVGRGAKGSDVTPRSTVRLCKEDLAFPADDRTNANQRSGVLKVLSEMAEILQATDPLQPIEPQLLQLAAGIIPAEQGAIVLASSFGDDSESVAGWNRVEGPCATPRVSQKLIDMVVGERTSFMSNDLAGSDATPETSPDRITSAIAAPLFINRKIYGVMYFDTTHPSERFDSSHLEFLTAISSYVALALEHGHRLQDLERENRRLREVVGIDHEMIGSSSAMRKVYERITRIAPTDATVLINGETGTGKELAAKAIHRNSPRADKPFEAINCALLNETMLESELFGHERGAFTGAALQRKGKFEIADGGTVFLDEIGELPQPTQAMLLRVLQDRSFYRLGGTRKLQVNIRVVAATNRNLRDAIREKTFREDLYYRLNVVSLAMPPLRERREDIPKLSHHFLARAAEKNKRPNRGISVRTMSFLQAYDWPGNVRELENAIEHALVFGSSDEIEPENLPDMLLEKAAEVGGTLKYHEAVLEAKKQIVIKALQQANGSYSEAAALLNVHVNNLHRLIRDLGIKKRAE